MSLDLFLIVICFNVWVALVLHERVVICLRVLWPFWLQTINEA